MNGFSQENFKISLNEKKKFVLFHKVAMRDSLP